jgi:hypothetical protein
MAYLAAMVTTTHVPARALSCKVAAGAFGSKSATNAKKTVMPVRKCRIPGIGYMVAASSEEFLESSPHGHAAWDLMAEIASRSEPHGQSFRALLPGFMPRLEPEASLQITAPLDNGRVSILDVTTTIMIG